MIPEKYSARREALRRLEETGRAERLQAGETRDAGDAEARRYAAQTERLVRGVLRHVSLIDELLTRGGLYDPKKTHRSLQWLLRLAAYETMFQAATPEYAVANESVELARAMRGERAARFMNAMARQLLPTLPRIYEGNFAG